MEIPCVSCGELYVQNHPHELYCDFCRLSQFESGRDMREHFSGYFDRSSMSATPGTRGWFCITDNLWPNGDWPYLLLLQQVKLRHERDVHSET